MARGEKNSPPSRSHSPSSLTERSSLLPRAPTAGGSRREDEPDVVANLDAALIVRNRRRQSRATKSVVHHEDPTAANQSISRMRGICVAFAVACLVFIVATNMSMLTTIQSAIASELDAFEGTSWFASTYLIAMSALSPLNGKLSEVFSPQLCIFVASIVLAIGAFICAWATTLEAFLVGRVFSGLGASGIFIVSMIIVLELTTPKRKGIAIGALNSGYTAGVAIGATAAGGLLHVTGWRALFWMQVPVVILGGSIILLAIPSGFTSGKKDFEDSDWTKWERIKRLDYLGAASLTASLVLLLYALSSPKEIPVLPLVLSVISVVSFVLIETYLANDPVIPVPLLKSRGLLLSCLGTVGFMMARWSVLFYTPTYAIAVRQWSASVGGSLLIPTNAGFAAGGLLVGGLHIKRQGSFYLPTLATYSLFPLSLLALAILSHREGSPAAFVVVLFVCGFTTGAALNYSLAHLLYLTPKETHYVATALIATFRGFAGSFGSAIGGGLFTRRLSESLRTQFDEHGMKRHSLIRRLLGSPALVEQLQGVEREIAKQGYEHGIQFLWLAAALLSAVMVLVQANVGWKGHDERQLLNGERRTTSQSDDEQDRLEETTTESL